MAITHEHPMEEDPEHVNHSHMTEMAKIGYLEDDIGDWSIL